MNAMAPFTGEPNHMAELCHAVAEYSPMPTAAMDGVNHIVRYVNPAFCGLMGRRKEQLIGSAFASILPTNEECLRLMDRVALSGAAEFHSGERGKEPHPHYWSYTIWPVHCAINTPINRPNQSANHRSFGIFLQVTESTRFHENAVAVNQALLLNALRQHELTERAEGLNNQLQTEMLMSKLSQDALIRSEKLASVGRMASVMAHEINNPLDAVMNAIYLTQGISGLPEPATEYLQIADEELKRISHITRQTLGFYRESTLSSNFLVASLLASVVDLLQAKIKIKQAVVLPRCDTGLQMRGNFGELRQVLANLLLNSLDAIEDHGTVKLRASHAAHSAGMERCLRITVADDGKGISAAMMPQIFEPFFTTKGSVGNGLGLWVSKQIIESHGGRIRARSATSGTARGTVVSIQLPVARADPPGLD